MHGRIATAASILTLGGTLYLLYLALLQNVIPLTSHRLVNAEITGIGRNVVLHVSREFCFSRPSDARAIREFQRIGRDGKVEDVLEAQGGFISLEQGCHVRNRSLELPEEIGEGRYRYNTALRWCNEVGRCQTYPLPPVFLRVEGATVNRRAYLERGSLE